MERRWGDGFAEPAWITVALFAITLAWDATGLDLQFAQLAGSVHGFPLRDHWLLAGVMHEGGRLLAWLLEVGLCLAVWWPIGPLARLEQGERLRLAVTSMLGALVVSLLKSASHASCPWDLSDFGGLAHYVSHWSLRGDGGAGRCFPAGHAASGFTFIGGYLAFLQVDRRTAWRWLAGALAAGMVLGLGQQWRGAHFMSHTLWSAAVCWGVACAVRAAWPRAWAAEAG